MTIDLPLTGLRVLDLAQGPTAAIARYLGELGSDVLRADPADRGNGLTGDTYAEGVSLDYAAANLGKRRVRLDLSGPQAQARLDALLEDADVLIETGEVDGAAAQARHPHLVVLSVSGFGHDSPISGWQATGPVLRALSGELSRSGIPGRAPLVPPGDLSNAVAIAQGVFVILAAYASRLRTGQGDWLDFSLMDATALALDPGYGIAGSATVGVPASKLPRGRPDSRHQYPIVPCEDGYVRICVLAPRQWQGMFEWLGRPEEFADPSFAMLQKRHATPTLIPAIHRLFAGKTRAELEVEGQKFGVPTAALLDLGEAMQSEQANARHLFKNFEIAPGITAPFPDGLVEIDGVRAGPACGIAVPAASAEWLPRGAVPAGPPPGERPLSGLRVLDFGVIVVGAEQGRMLADLGAEVYKVETAAFADGARQSMDRSPLPVTFAAGHRNKKGLGLNLRDPEGKALLLRLVAQSDIIVSNFKPGVLESLGLGYDVLKTVHPGIIMIDSSAFGPSGPWSRRLGYGPLVRASTGLTAQWCYPGEPDTFSDGMTVYPDHVAGRIGAIAALALLIRRWRTGKGGTGSISQAEVMLNHMAVPAAALALHVPVAEPDAPWGVFAAQGDDEWCVVTARGDADWQALCRVIGCADLLAEPELSRSAGRAAQRSRIDAAVAAWVAQHPAQEAMAILQDAGVPAGAMLRVSELPEFLHFKARNVFTLVSHPRIAEPFYLETAPVKARHLPLPEQHPAPVVGEHTADVARVLLGLDEAEITRLVEANILETYKEPPKKSDAPPVLIAREGHVMVITLNRPEARNAVNLAMHMAVGEALETAEKNPEIRAVVVTGAGDQAFCAGADLKALMRGEKLQPDDETAKSWGFAGLVAHYISKPVIAAVNGAALGGGTEIVLACDLAVAADNAILGLPEVKRGIYAGAGGAFRIVQQLPKKLAMELLLTGEPISAQRALELGLLNRVVPRAELLKAALELAAGISANAPLAVQASKRIALGIHDGQLAAEEPRWRHSHAEGAKILASADAMEGARAFAEKRAPQWKAR